METKRRGSRRCCEGPAHHLALLQTFAPARLIAFAAGRATGAAFPIAEAGRRLA